VQDIFTQIATASATRGGQYIKDGAYRYIIEKCWLENKQNGLCFGMEFAVKTSAKNHATIDPDPVGASVSNVQNFKHKSATGNVKAFVLAALGLEEHAVSDADFAATLQQIVSEAQPLRGMEVDNITYRQLTRDKTKELVLCRFSHVPGQTAESVAANRAKLDAGQREQAPAAPAPLMGNPPQVAYQPPPAAPGASLLGAPTPNQEYLRQQPTPYPTQQPAPYPQGVTVAPGVTPGVPAGSPPPAPSFLPVPGQVPQQPVYQPPAPAPQQGPAPGSSLLGSFMK
jgi:hypothetical protein